MQQAKFSHEVPGIKGDQFVLTLGLTCRTLDISVQPGQCAGRGQADIQLAATGKTTLVFHIRFPFCLVLLSTGRLPGLSGR